MRVWAVMAALAAAIFACGCSGLGELEQPDSAGEGGARQRVLSRRRRYLVYPEGSSLQLVYCLTVPTVVPLPFFKFGWTLGLAWELPSDGRQIVEYKKKFREALRRPTTEPPPPPPPEHDHYQHDHEYQPPDEYSRHFGYDHMHRGEVLVHRRDRRTLYDKVEGAFSSMGVDGRSCVLRFLCESRQRVAGTGNFLQEILRAVFTLPEARGRDLDDADLRHYDAAHRQRRDAAPDCDLLYPECDVDSIFDYQLPID